MRETGFTVGHGDADGVRVTVTGRAHPDRSDFWDGNWLHSPISGACGGFRFELAGAQLRADEIERFREQLRVLHRDQTGVACLSSLEDWVDLTVTGHRSGRYDVTGELLDRPGPGNRLHFRIEDYDRALLPPLLAQLDRVLSAYPVLGDAPD